MKKHVMFCQKKSKAAAAKNKLLILNSDNSSGDTSGKKAIIAVSRKLLKMIYILLEKGQYYDPNYAVKATE